jgi:3'(2'), 5'-bisphosphate nucleotidase
MKDIDIKKIIDIAVAAGKEIMTVYEQDFSVELKGDNSPLTQADQKSNALIVKRSKKVTPTFPLYPKRQNSLLTKSVRTGTCTGSSILWMVQKSSSRRMESLQ